MLEILEQHDHSRYPLPAVSAGCDLRVFEVMEEAAVAGHAVASFAPDCVTVYTCEAQALALLDGLARTVLFHAVLRGIHKGQFLAPDVRLITLKLCDEAGVCADIDALLGGCAHCKESDL